MPQNFNEKKNLLVSIKGAAGSNQEGYSTLNTVTMPLHLPLESLNSAGLENTLLRNNNDLSSSKEKASKYSQRVDSQSAALGDSESKRFYL